MSAIVPLHLTLITEARHYAANTSDGENGGLASGSNGERTSHLAWLMEAFGFVISRALGGRGRVAEVARRGLRQETESVKCAHSPGEAARISDHFGISAADGIPLAWSLSFSVFFTFLEVILLRSFTNAGRRVHRDWPPSADVRPGAGPEREEQPIGYLPIMPFRTG